MDDNVAILHKEAVVVDTHCDTLKCFLPQFTTPRNSQWDDRSSVGLGVKSKMGHIDIPRLKEGGVDCQVFAISSSREKTPPYALRTALEMIDRFYLECEINRQAIIPVTSYNSILKTIEEGKIASLLSIEGADIIEGKISMLRIFYRLGIRIVGLVHSFRNLLADGVSDSRTRGGLSELGVQAIEESNRLGILVDVSHLNDAGFWDLIDITKSPLLASHSNCRAICSHPRNMTDDMIKAMADLGGVIGINFAPFFVHKTKATLQKVVDHIDHIVKLAGIDFVGLGTDFDGIPSTPIGLEDVTKLPDLTNELFHRGYSKKDIEMVLGGNHLRLIKKVIG